MNGMPFDMILTQPLAETFSCSGLAVDVGMAHNLAWTALQSSLGADPIEAWAMKFMQHAYSTDPEGVAFTAEFVRNPEYEAES